MRPAYSIETDIDGDAPCVAVQGRNARPSWQSISPVRRTAAASRSRAALSATVLPQGIYRTFQGGPSLPRASHTPASALLITTLAASARSIHGLPPVRCAGLKRTVPMTARSSKAIWHSPDDMRLR